jgi:hypothetical protein
VTAHADKENNETGGSDATIVDAAPEDEDEFVIEDLQVEPTTHAVLHAQRRMFLSPPLDDARRHWMAKLQSDVVGVCANLPRLHVQDLSMASRQRAPGHTTTYGNKLVQQVPAKALESCWRALDRRLGEASTFVSGWLQYQALWGLQAKDVVDRLTFEARVLALEAYQRSSEGGSGHGGGYGKMPPLSHTTEDGVMLGAWCLVQKRLKGLGLLTTAQVQRLDSLGFNWAPPAPSISSGSGSGGGASAERGSEEEARQKAAAAVAALNGHATTIKLLAELGVDFETVTPDGFSIIHFASIGGFETITSYLDEVRGMQGIASSGSVAVIQNYIVSSLPIIAPVQWLKLLPDVSRKELAAWISSRLKDSSACYSAMFHPLVGKSSFPFRTKVAHDGHSHIKKSIISFLVYKEPKTRCTLRLLNNSLESLGSIIEAVEQAEMELKKAQLEVQQSRARMGRWAIASHRASRSSHNISQGALNPFT